VENLSGHSAGHFSAVPPPPMKPSMYDWLCRLRVWGVVCSILGGLWTYASLKQQIADDRPSYLPPVHGSRPVEPRRPHSRPFGAIWDLGGIAGTHP